MWYVRDRLRNAVEVVAGLLGGAINGKIAMWPDGLMYVKTDRMDENDGMDMGGYDVNYGMVG